MCYNLKTQIVMKLKNSNGEETKNLICEETQKLKLWQDSNSNGYHTQKLKLGQNSKNSNCDKTQIVTKLKLWQNSNCDNIKIVTKLENTNCNKTRKLELWHNLEVWKVSIKKKKFKGSLNKKILTPSQPMRCSLGSVLRFSQCFFINWDLSYFKLSQFEFLSFVLILAFELCQNLSSRVLSQFESHWVFF